MAPACESPPTLAAGSRKSGTKRRGNWAREVAARCRRQSRPGRPTGDAPSAPATTLPPWAPAKRPFRPTAAPMGAGKTSAVPAPHPRWLPGSWLTLPNTSAPWAPAPSTKTPATFSPSPLAPTARARRNTSVTPPSPKPATTDPRGWEHPTACPCHAPPSRPSRPPLGPPRGARQSPSPVPVSPKSAP